MTDNTDLPSLYSVTGDIKDINTLLIGRGEAVRLNAQAVPCCTNYAAGTTCFSDPKENCPMLSAAPQPAQVVPDAASEFNRAIDFAIEQGSEAASFLRSWRGGDVSEWPEFPQLLSAVVPQLDDFENFDAVLGRFEHKERGLLQAQMAAPQPAQHWVKAPEIWPIAPDVSADLERSDWSPEDALRWYAAGKHYDTVPNGDGTSSARILDNGAVASNALKSLSRKYAEHKGDVALQEIAAQPPQLTRKIDLGCSSCANADSWGLPDKPLCNACTVGSAGVGTGYIPLNT